MSNVEMPKKLRGFFCTKCGSHECKAGFEEEQHPPCNKCDYFGFGADLDYTEAQLKQYGDDRAREALEMAAKVCETGWGLPSGIRALAKEIK
jgi:hypothetical protein